MSYICIHGHFYQPPRENPWLEAIELQDTAHPYHDWNERITAECYARNTAARILDDAGRIVKIVSNYPKISFDFGPTLLSWLETRAPKVYRSILDADKASQEHFSGHGSAVAQAYNHMIMPLANRRDKVTQVIWGIRDFEHRFGRRPEGLWLPETAVDTETLEILAEHEIRFTILAARQARRVSKIGGRLWKDVAGERIDPSMAYLCSLPSGRTINLFFYDGPISRAIAFENLLASGEQFVDRLMSGFAEEVRPWPELVHVATDGETFGHHHQMGEMTLAFALDRIEARDLARITNYAEYLERHPPIHRVEIVEESSWSCIHGVERWRSNCGCNSGGHSGWNQEWRAPLRQALDGLRDTVTSRYQEEALSLFADPWAARDDYIDVVLDRSPDRVDRFFRRHATRELHAADRVTALKLLEMQRHAMLMYTSCGWFFDELSGIEAVQCMQYAGRVIDLARQLFPEDVETAFLEKLSQAKSNILENGDGAQIYRKYVQPAVIDLRKVAAHYAIASVLEPSADLRRVYCYEVQRENYAVRERERRRLAFGRIRICSTITTECAPLTFVALHLDDHQIKVGVRETHEDAAYMAMVNEFSEAFLGPTASEVVQRLDEAFGNDADSLHSLFKDEQRTIIELMLRPLVAEAEAAHIRLYTQNADLMRLLTDLQIPLPKTFRASAEFALNHQLRKEFLGDEPNLHRVAPLIEQAKAVNVSLDLPMLEYALRNRLEQMAERLSAGAADPLLLSRFQAAVDLARSLPFQVNLWQVQNLFYEQLRCLARQSLAGIQQAPEAIVAGELARLGETLLFTPQALNVLLSIEHRRNGMNVARADMA
jgi:alpha-amylase/alpha-mannosidase (GH57 family)